MKKFFFRLLGWVLVILIALTVFLLYNSRDRFPNQKLDISIKPTENTTLRVGFSALKITPTLEDIWTDVNNDAQYEPENGDSYQDVNQNGRFDAHWLAGFSNNRPANGVHDDIWARTMVIDDGKTRMAIISLDLIGVGNDDVLRIRQAIPANAGITYAMVGSTHVHEAPDVTGIWGPNDYKTGLNPAFMAYMIAQAAKSVETAAAQLRPAKMIYAQDPTGAASMVSDSRPPQVFDNTLHVLEAKDAENGSILGTLVVWGNHPETVSSKNLLISSDFPHYVRESLEKGIFRGDTLKQKGLGGTVVYLSGAIGGLMTTSSGVEIKDAFSEQIYVKPDFEKVRVEGEQLAILAIKALQNKPDTLQNPSLGIVAQNFEIPLGNPMFRLGVLLNIFNRGFSHFGFLRSEAAIVTLGDLTFMCVPGEIYPEIVHGGVETPSGADFSVAPIETPPLMQLLPGKHKITLGLMNDAIGYIIPRSQWDSEAPYSYGRKDKLYGEISSCGAETGPVVYGMMKNLCEKVK
jgi:hypothetical protein